MRRWVLFCVLCLAVFVVLPAHATVHFKGLQCTATGACVADLDADGRLDIGNLGSSGQDGVSIWSPRSNGMRLALDGACSSSDAGASVSLAFDVSVGGVTLTPRVRLAVTPSACVLQPDFSSVSSGSPTETVTLSRAGQVVATLDVPSGSPVSLAFDAATGACPLPEIFCAIGRRVHAIHAGVSFSSPVRVSVGGTVEDCDDVDFSAPLDAAAFDCVASSAELRVVSPPGSSFSRVRCSDGSCRVMDQWVSATGGAVLDLDAFASSAGRRLPVHNLGSSGEDGIETSLRLRESPTLSHLRSSIDGDAGSAALDAVLSPPSLLFDPATDDGGATVLTVVGTNFAPGGTATPASASLAMNLGSQSSAAGAGRVAVLQVVPDHSHLGATMEWATVLSHGVEVARVSLPPGSPVSVLAPPGGSPTFPVASYGSYRGNCCRGHVIIMKTPQDGATGARPASSSPASSSVDQSCPLEVSFRCDRVFVVGGLQVTGDQLVCSGDDPAGNYGGTFVVTVSTCLFRPPSPASPLTSVEFLDLAGAAGDAIGPTVGGASITASSTCASIPFTFTRVDSTPVRAYSVTFHLSPELATCGARVVEGDYLSSVAGTQMFVTDNGGGSYTVDCTIMGPACGATGSGRLFSLQLGAAAGVTSAVGSVAVDALTARDCSNHAVAAIPGPDGFVPVQLTSPPALAGLTATQVKTGNPAGLSTTGVQLAWPALSSAGTSVQVFRKGFGNYPLYDNAPAAGSVPAAPVSPAAAVAAGWEPVSCGSGTCSSGACASGACSATQLFDFPPSRDFLYYVAFTRDAFGNASPASNRTPGTLDYYLGDVSDGTVACSGDDRVNTADVSLLGMHYGAAVSSGSSFACLDVGPTTDYSVDARPTTDGRVNFEDLMMFAMNFTVAAAPQLAARATPVASDAIRLQLPATLPAVGESFDAVVLMDGAGDVQGASVRLTYDPAVLEQVAVAGGSLLGEQSRPSLVLSSGPGNVDAALLGTGAGIAGSGELARVTFRVKAAGAARLAIAGLSARGSDNTPVLVAGADAGAPPEARTGLGIVFPNPFRDGVVIRMSLRRDAAASLAVFDVTGRRVRTLLSGVQPAGARTMTWDASDESGVRLAPGAYLLRLDAGDIHQTRMLRLVR